MIPLFLILLTTLLFSPTALAEGNQEQKNMPDSVHIQIQEATRNVQRVMREAGVDNGLGEQVREVARVQQEAQQAIQQSVQVLNQRRGLARFILGPNYQELEQLEQKVEEAKQTIEQVKELKEQAETLRNSEAVRNLEQLQTALQEQNQTLKEQIAEYTGHFSLFGWLMKLFN